MNQIIQNAVKALVAMAVVVFLFFAPAFFDNPKAEAQVGDAYTTYVNVSTTVSCFYIPTGCIFCLWDDWATRPDPYVNVCGSYGAVPLCPSGSRIHAIILNDSCGGGYTCTNSGIPDPYTKTVITQVYTCHYISYVFSWGPCYGGVQVADDVDWASVPGTICSNVPLLRDCSSPYSCTGSIVSHASAWDSEESSSLTSNVNWSHASSDTATKCQYHCNTGYTWNGSSCVLSTAPSLDLTAAPNPVDYNTASTLTWTTANVTSCTASGDWTTTGAKSASGGTESTGPLTTAKTYSMTCQNAVGTNVTDSVTVNVNAGSVPVTTFTGTWNGGNFYYPNPYMLRYYPAQNDQTTINIPIPYYDYPRTYGPFRIYLDWSVTNATGGSCTGYSTANLSGWSSSGTSGKPISGNDVRVDVSKTTEFYLDCWNAAGVAAERKTVRVNILNSTMPTLNIWSDPSTVNQGSSSTINWTTTNASTCRTVASDWAGDQAKPVNGSYPTGALNTAKTYYYKMQCFSADGTSSGPKTAPVVVNACVEDCACADSTCVGQTCPGNCGDCDGTLTASCGSWGDCSVNCGGGTQTRSCFCPTKTETRACNTQPCPPGYREVTPW